MNKALEDYYFQELDALYNQALVRVQKIREAGTIVYPDQNQELACLFSLGDLRNVKVVIVGQDPYINPGQAHGLAFSVQPGTDRPPSLVNIIKELQDDLSTEFSDTGCLQSWAEQGVLLLNRVLTVEEGKSKSHAGLGWEEFTERLLTLVDELNSGIVFLLWGKDAQKICPLLTNESNLALKAPHPSPFSAHRGFFGCKHFSKTNEFLISAGNQPINWGI